MKYPFEKQSDLKDCGVSCLLMILRYYGGGVSKEYLRNLTNTTKDGTTAYSIIEASKILGFTSYGVKGNIELIKEKELPCIAHVVINKNYQHFIVIYKIDKKKKYLLIADPAKKEISKINFNDFNKISTNQYILLEPRKKLMYIKKNTVLNSIFTNFVLNNLKNILTLLIFSIIITVFNIISSFQLKIIMEYVINYQNLNNLVFIGFTFFWIILIKELSNYFRNNLINNINHNLDKTLFTNVYNHILSLPYLYYKNRTTGEIISRIEDISCIRNVISKLLVTLFLDLILAIFTLIALFYLNIKLTSILLISILFIFITILIFRKPLEKKINNSKVESANLNSFLVETIGGIETIKNQNIEDYIKKNFLLKYCKYNKINYSYNKLFILEQLFKDIIDQIGILCIVIVGSILVINNNLEIPTLITYITLTSYLLNPIKNIIDIDLSYKEAKSSLNRIKELYEIEEEKNSTYKNTSKHLTGNIKTKNLIYSYNNKDYQLKNINLDINQGDKVLIYGGSGSGKSTLAKILSKQLEIKNKQLFYDDKDINNYCLSDIKNQICYISQQETLFTDSIYQNIVLNKNIDYDSFLETTKSCKVDEFVSNYNLAYDTLLEENGFNISGGQRQRIILARSLLKNANIYILDESLNEVDVIKEREILKELFNKYKNKTFIVVSHRFHNQDLFNKKYKIEQGISYEE